MVDQKPSGLVISEDGVFSSKKELGEDERQLLDALHGRGALGERLRKEQEAQKNRAKHKIEVIWGRNRTVALEKCNHAGILIWESGRRFHGGGDQKMYFCGFLPPDASNDDVCGRPIYDKSFGMVHCICPHCNRECFLDDGTKVKMVQHARSERQPAHKIRQLEKIPVISGIRLVNLPPAKMSTLLAKIYRDLGCNADIYFKYPPTDIRCRDVPEIKKPDLYAKARQDRTERKENRGLLIYPQENIVRDTMNGSSLEKRFLSMILA